MERLGTLLIEQGSLKRDQLDFGLKIQKNNGRSRLGQLLLHYNFITELDVARALARQVGWQLYEGGYELDQDSAKVLGIDFLISAGVYPLKSPTGKVCVLTCANDTKNTDTILQVLACPVYFMVGVETHVRRALELCKPTSVPKIHNIIDDDLLSWFEALMEKAVAKSATDIHIESSSKAVEIRLRIDGLLRFEDSLKLVHLPKLINVIFNKADVTISDFYHFHDARFSHPCGNRQLDVRVSHVPSVHGSSLVLRLLDTNKTVVALTDLGYAAGHWGLIESALAKPEGVILIAGPTGCGKTTTLYAMLNNIKDLSRKIVTVEDPVEMQLPLVTQVQMQPQRNITFGSTVRAFLRHDPDIMLIGEIRDHETAQEAMRASMTGHKVFATLHAARAFDVLLRLEDLGVDPKYIANYLTMVIAQRLVRKLCPHCKLATDVSKINLKEGSRKYVIDNGQMVALAVGCARCEQGYEGRTVVAEILFIDDMVQDAITQQSLVQLRKTVKGYTGYISFEHDARRLIANQMTTLEEIVRVLG